MSSGSNGRLRHFQPHPRHLNRDSHGLAPLVPNRQHKAQAVWSFSLLDLFRLTCNDVDAAFRQLTKTAFIRIYLASFKVDDALACMRQSR